MRLDSGSVLVVATRGGGRDPADPPASGRDAFGDASRQADQNKEPRIDRGGNTSHPQPGQTSGRERAEVKLQG